MSDENVHTACRIAPQSRSSLVAGKAKILRVTDPCDEQVADLFAFNHKELTCSLSAGRSIDYAARIFLSTGDVLYANDSQPMFTIAADTVGQHDFLLTPCSQEMFEKLYQHVGHHPSCFKNLCASLAAYHNKPEQITTMFNIFRNVRVDLTGRVSALPPRSRAGDFIELRADMNTIFALNAWSAEKSNNDSFQPIDHQVLTA